MPIGLLAGLRSRLLDGEHVARDSLDPASDISRAFGGHDTAVQTAVDVITTGVLIALLAGIAMKLRLIGPNP